MSTRLIWIAAAVCALVLTGCQQQAPVAEVSKGPSVEQDLAALRAVGVDEYTRAYNAMDTPALAALFTSNAIHMGPDQPAVEGREAIEAHFRTEFEGARKHFERAEGRVTVDDASVVGDWAYMRGGYLWAGKPKTGAQTERKGKWLAVYQRQPDGGWKIHRVVSNTNHPLELAK